LPALQEHEKELRVHLRGHANQGVNRLEAEEMMMHIFIYIGWPKALEARRIMTEVFEELKIS
jgi:alkylhydroperoxidase/carboxymuconolactone decarboxylase family protein YurZ